jgi:hypothetical protein
MGWDNLDWVSTVGDDFHRGLGFLHAEEELRPFLQGEIPPTVEQNARMCGKWTSRSAISIAASTISRRRRSPVALRDPPRGG